MCRCSRNVITLSVQAIHERLYCGQGNAWSHSLKHQLACGTVVIFVNPHYTDFFSRALKPSEDVLWVTDMNPATLCDHIKGLMQNMTQEEGQRLADASKRFIEENLLMDKVYGYIIKLLQEYAKLQRFNPVRFTSCFKLLTEFQDLLLLHLL